MTKFMAITASIIFTFTTALASLLGNVNIIGDSNINQMVISTST